MRICMMLHSVYNMQRSGTDTDRGPEGTQGGDAPVLREAMRWCSVDESNLDCVVSLDLTSQEHGKLWTMSSAFPRAQLSPFNVTMIHVAKAEGQTIWCVMALHD